MASEAGVELVDIVSHVIVLVVHAGFGVFVAGAQATEGSEIVWLQVAGLAGIPRVFVVAAKNGEVLAVVVEFDGIPVVLVMAIEAGGLNACPGVLVVVVGLVAADAVEVAEGVVNRCEVGGFVARGASEAFVGAYQVEAAGSGKVVEQCSLPLQVCVASLAGEREVGGHMVDEDRGGIVVFVAIDASRGKGREGTVCIVGMATDAGDLAMGAG